jgi:hypothetical protein
MSTMVNTAQNLRFKIGWIILLIATALMTLNHATLIFAEDEPILFTGFAAFTLYAFLVIYIPFRRAEKWAWYTTWILPIGLAASAFSITDPNIALLYYTFAALCGLGLLLTMPDFFARD